MNELSAYHHKKSNYEEQHITITIYDLDFIEQILELIRQNAKDALDQDLWDEALEQLQNAEKLNEAIGEWECESND